MCRIVGSTMQQEVHELRKMHAIWRLIARQTEALNTNLRGIKPKLIRESVIVIEQLRVDVLPIQECEAECCLWALRGKSSADFEPIQTNAPCGRKAEPQSKMQNHHHFVFLSTELPFVVFLLHAESWPQAERR